MRKETKAERALRLARDEFPTARISIVNGKLRVEWPGTEDGPDIRDVMDDLDRWRHRLGEGNRAA